MIILSSRTMAPRNVMSRVISASSEEMAVLKQAAQYFASACRSIVGYKQLIAQTGLDIVVESKAKTEVPEIQVQFEEPKVEEVRPTRNRVLDKFKVKRRRQYDIVNPNLVKEEPKEVLPTPSVDSWVPTITDDIWVPEEMYNEVVNREQPPVSEEVFIPECIPTEDDYVILDRAPIVEEQAEVNFVFFVNEIKKGLQLKATRGREDVAGVVKAVWNKYKGEFVSEVDKAAAKQFCIEVHASFNQLMDEQPRHWFFISVAVYVNGYFQEAIARCTP